LAPRRLCSAAEQTVHQPPSAEDQLPIVFVDVTGAGGKIAIGWEKTLALVDFGLPAH
jgi:hypothetical protein